VQANTMEKSGNVEQSRTINLRQIS